MQPDLMTTSQQGSPNELARLGSPNAQKSLTACFKLSMPYAKSVLK